MMDFNIRFNLFIFNNFLSKLVLIIMIEAFPKVSEIVRIEADFPP